MKASKIRKKYPLKHLLGFVLNNKHSMGLNWEQMEKQGGSEVIKGLSHRVIVVKSPNRLFEEAIFVIRDDAFSETGADSDAVLKEARRAANTYVKGTACVKSVSYKKLPAPFFVAAGAAATGIAWLTMRLCGV